MGVVPEHSSLNHCIGRLWRVWPTKKWKVSTALGLENELVKSCLRSSLWWNYKGYAAMLLAIQCYWCLLQTSSNYINYHQLLTSWDTIHERWRAMPCRIVTNKFAWQDHVLWGKYMPWDPWNQICSDALTYTGSMLRNPRTKLFFQPRHPETATKRSGIRWKVTNCSAYPSNPSVVFGLLLSSHNSTGRY